MNLAKYSLDNTKIIYFFLAVLLIGGSRAGRSGTSDNRAYLSRDTKYEWCVQD